MDTQNYRRKWRNFLIRKDIQLRLAIYNLLFLLVAIGFVIAMALIPLYLNFQNPDNLWSQHFSAKFFLVIVDRLVLAFAGIFVVAFIFQIIITHRFAGPLINFGKTFQKISHGDLTRKICLRRKDFLHTEASQVNAMTDALIRLFVNIKEDNDRLLLILEEAASGKCKDDQLEATLSEAVKQAGRCKAHLSKLKIPFDVDTEIN
ncbi:MAG: methyl-accepting chemotaxis protein [Deltaproteobacteria bacterium]|jgi:methyl-accepting chemotaxis protein|nr:methyl-accepting chemotaxis protein [Deltaproteobacteria bacterium]MBW2469869.1 methyl-accepting chemotaxis protein [Deltaproteobacteria bacterium]MBW2517421.1 methyl-accepting chemotaxis protein [Deltaproteobacteria bacterium]